MPCCSISLRMGPQGRMTPSSDVNQSKLTPACRFSVEISTTAAVWAAPRGLHARLPARLGAQLVVPGVVARQAGEVGVQPLAVRRQALEVLRVHGDAVHDETEVGDAPAVVAGLGDPDLGDVAQD